MQCIVGVKVLIYILFVVDNVILDDRIARELAKLLQDSSCVALNNHTTHKLLQPVRGLAAASSGCKFAIPFQTVQCITNNPVVLLDLFEVEGVIAHADFVDDVEDGLWWCNSGPVELHDVAPIAVYDDSLVFFKVMHVATKKELRHLHHLVVLLLHINVEVKGGLHVVERLGLGASALPIDAVHVVQEEMVWLRLITQQPLPDAFSKRGVFMEEVLQRQMTNASVSIPQ